ncbi:hypothetical protein [Nocardia salmonicida]|uniref:hypothetical protein n=1 Tax=Nocardia salmonicida TaxID=53431 RepID=UPI0037B62ED2
MKLSLEVIEAIDAAVEDCGLSRRAIYEIALRQLLGLDPYPGAPREGDDPPGQLSLAS